MNKQIVFSECGSLKIIISVYKDVTELKDGSRDVIPLLYHSLTGGM